MSEPLIDLNSENTEISLTNTHLTSSVAVHYFYIDGSNGTANDSFIFLAPGQTFSMLASDFDPGVRGYLIAIAVDSLTGCPLSFNHLIGSETIKLATGHAASFGAQAFAALFIGTSTDCSPGASTTTLNFDGNPFSGSSYNRLPQTLALNHISSLGDGDSTLLTVSRIGGDLSTSLPAIGSLSGVLYDPLENGYGFTFSSGSQLLGTLSNNFPRTTPRFSNIIPTGSFGWMKLAPPSNVGIIGAALTFNPNASSNQNAFISGANLAALTFAGNVTLTMPVSVPPVSGSFSTTIISATPNPSQVGQSVTFTATVSATTTGNVQFYDGFSLLGTGTLSGNTATLTTSTLTLGTHLITAVYLGDATFTRSASPGLTQTVNLAGPKAGSTTALVSSANPSGEGDVVSFTATVSGSGTPTGTVEFFDGASSLGTVALNGNSAMMSLSNLSATTHAITAVYSVMS